MPAEAAPEDVRRRKQMCRRRVRGAILAMPAAERGRQERAILARVPLLPGYADASSVLLYVPAFPEEIDIRPLLRQVAIEGRELILPRMEPGTRALRLARIGDIDRDLEPGVLGIPEPRAGQSIVDPAAIGWALIPGLAFTARCERLGRGAGCYDRLLPLLPAATPRWSLALEPQWVESLPWEEHDQLLDGVLGAERVAHRAPAP